MVKERIKTALHARKFRLALLSGIIFVCGGLVGTAFVLATYRYPDAVEVFDGGGQGVMVRGIVYEHGRLNPIWWDKDGATVLKFWDWKNDHEPMRVVYPHATREIQTLYNDETLTIVSVDKTTLYLHHRSRDGQSIEKREYVHPVVAVFPDAERLVTYRDHGNSLELVVTDLDGKELFGRSGIPPLYDFRDFLVFDDGKKVAFFLDLDFAPAPPRLLVWDIGTGNIFEVSDAPVAERLKAGEKPYVPDDGRLLISPDNINALEDQRYVNNELGVFFEFPWHWGHYGNPSEFGIAALLESRFFMPEYDPFSEFEVQHQVFFHVYDPDIPTEFDAPEIYLQNVSETEKWNPVIVNGYSATEVSSRETGEVTHYIFRHDDLLYVFGASDPRYLDTILSEISFSSRAREE